MQCPLCGLPTKLVPAGVSRATGKPYNAFFACTDPTRTCTFKQPAQSPAAPMRAMNNIQTKSNEQKDLEKSTGMVRHGFAIESYKMGKKLDAPTAREITDWTNFVMTGRLTKSVQAEEQVPVIQVEDEYSQPDPNEINIKDIPF